MAIVVRDAVTADLGGIARIYNDAVAHTTTIWEDEAVTLADRAAWLAMRHKTGHPVLVASERAGEAPGEAGGAGDVLGYASFGPFRPQAGFRHTVEHSIYVERDRRGRGIGTMLLTALIARARALDKHVMIAAIDAGNEASAALHERLGFVGAGTLREVGVKFGRRLDLTLMQLILAPAMPG